MAFLGPDDVVWSVTPLWPRPNRSFSWIISWLFVIIFCFATSNEPHSTRNTALWQTSQAIQRSVEQSGFYSISSPAAFWRWLSSEWMPNVGLYETNFPPSGTRVHSLRQQATFEQVGNAHVLSDGSLNHARRVGATLRQKKSSGSACSKRLWGVDKLEQGACFETSSLSSAEPSWEIRRFTTTTRATLTASECSEGCREDPACSGFVQGQGRGGILTGVWEQSTLTTVQLPVAHPFLTRTWRSSLASSTNRSACYFLVAPKNISCTSSAESIAEIPAEDAVCVANIDSRVLREGECPLGGEYCPSVFSTSSERQQAVRTAIGNEVVDGAWEYSEEWADGGGTVGLLAQYGEGGFGLRVDAATSAGRARALQEQGWLDRDSRMASVEWWVNVPGAALALRCALTMEGGPSGAWEAALTVRGWGGTGEGPRAVLLALCAVAHGWWAAWYAWRYHSRSVWCRTARAVVRVAQRCGRWTWSTARARSQRRGAAEGSAERRKKQVRDGAEQAGAVKEGGAAPGGGVAEEEGGKGEEGAEGERARRSVEDGANSVGWKTEPRGGSRSSLRKAAWEEESGPRRESVLEAGQDFGDKGAEDADGAWRLSSVDAYAPREAAKLEAQSAVEGDGGAGEAGRRLPSTQLSNARGARRADSQRTIALRGLVRGGGWEAEDGRDWAARIRVEFWPLWDATVEGLLVWRTLEALSLLVSEQGRDLTRSWVEKGERHDGVSGITDMMLVLGVLRFWAVARVGVMLQRFMKKLLPQALALAAIVAVVTFGVSLGRVAAVAGHAVLDGGSALGRGVLSPGVPVGPRDGVDGSGTERVGTVWSARDTSLRGVKWPQMAVGVLEALLWFEGTMAAFESEEPRGRDGWWRRGRGGGGPARERRERVRVGQSWYMGGVAASIDTVMLVVCGLVVGPTMLAVLLYTWERAGRPDTRNNRPLTRLEAALYQDVPQQDLRALSQWLAKVRRRGVGGLLGWGEEDEAMGGEDEDRREADHDATEYEPYTDVDLWRCTYEKVQQTEEDLAKRVDEAGRVMVQTVAPLVNTLALLQQMRIDEEVLHMHRSAHGRATSTRGTGQAEEEGLEEILFEYGSEAEVSSESSASESEVSEVPTPRRRGGWEREGEEGYLLATLESVRGLGEGHWLAQGCVCRARALGMTQTRDVMCGDVMLGAEGEVHLQQHFRFEASQRLASRGRLRLDLWPLPGSPASSQRSARAEEEPALVIVQLKALDLEAGAVDAWFRMAPEGEAHVTLQFQPIRAPEQLPAKTLWGDPLAEELASEASHRITPLPGATDSQISSASDSEDSPHSSRPTSSHPSSRNGSAAAGLVGGRRRSSRPASGRSLPAPSSRGDPSPHPDARPQLPPTSGRPSGRQRAWAGDDGG